MYYIMMSFNIYTSLATRQLSITR